MHTNSCYPAPLRTTIHHARLRALSLTTRTIPATARTILPHAAAAPDTTLISLDSALSHTIKPVHHCTILLCSDSYTAPSGTFAHDPTPYRTFHHHSEPSLIIKYHYAPSLTSVAQQSRTIHHVHHSQFVRTTSHHRVSFHIIAQHMVPCRIMSHN